MFWWLIKRLIRIQNKFQLLSDCPFKLQRFSLCHLDHWSLLGIKGTQAWHFFKIPLQKPKLMVPRACNTRFLKSYSIRPRHSTFKHFRVRSASDEILSAYAQCATKLVQRMLSINLHVKAVHILPLAEHARKFVPRIFLDISSKRFGSAYAHCSVTAKMFELRNSGKNWRKKEAIFLRFAFCENLPRA